MDITSYILGKKAGGGGVTPTGTIQITSNGETDVTNYATADVNVQPDLESKSVTITTNTTTTITPSQDKDGLSSVEVITNVPTGATINGTLENKTISSGSVSKGDFVASGTSTITDTLNNYYLGSVTTITDEANMYDNDDTTYAIAQKANGVSGVVTISLTCKSASSLNIPLTAKITDFRANFKINFYTPNFQNTGRIAYQLLQPNSINSKFSYAQELYSNIYTQEVEKTSDNYYTLSNGLMKIDASLLDRMGINFNFATSVTQLSSIYIYYCKFIITYEDNGKIHTVTSNADTIFGIANENGNANDTIQVYVPNIS